MEFLSKFMMKNCKTMTKQGSFQKNIKYTSIPITTNPK